MEINIGWFRIRAWLYSNEELPRFCVSEAKYTKSRILDFPLNYKFGENREIIGGASFKTVSVLFYISALIVYGLSFTTYAYQFFTMNFSIATITPILVNIVTISLLSFFYYREGLSLYQGIGILLAIVFVVLFSK